MYVIGLLFTKYASESLVVLDANTGRRRKVYVNPAVAQRLRQASAKLFQEKKPAIAERAPEETIGTLSTETVNSVPRISEKVRHEKLQQALELKRFERYFSQGSWLDFHGTHYDWWMFPINKVSSQGTKYCFSLEELQELRADGEFLSSYRRGVELEALSWGWDVKTSSRVQHPGSGQAWTKYGIRLIKMADSLWLLEQYDLFASMQVFASQMLRCGEMSDEAGVLCALHMSRGGDRSLIKNESPDLSVHESTFDYRTCKHRINLPKGLLE